MKKLHTHKVVIKWINEIGEVTREEELGRFASLNWAEEFRKIAREWMRSVSDKRDEKMWSISIEAL